ncbi:hypothetical protein [Microvirus mar10]|uniref:Uncharacterized protein n=1 Tax=Microvirus mar10 TaxID=2851142 RepID=A0A8F5MKX5_9VIRU|nr:hypothetical protein [Microvirus mar10]
MIVLKCFEESCKPVEGQKFDYLVQDYIYNPETKLLSVSPIKKDIYEYINSFASSSLDAILDKYTSISSVDVDAPVASREQYDLNSIALAFEKAEDYRTSRNLSDDLSIEEIYTLMLKESEDLKNEIIKKGGEQSEKKAQSEQTLQP